MVRFWLVWRLGYYVLFKLGQVECYDDGKLMPRPYQGHATHFRVPRAWQALRARCDHQSLPDVTDIQVESARLSMFAGIEDLGCAQ